MMYFPCYFYVNYLAAALKGLNHSQILSQLTEHIEQSALPTF